MSIQTNIVPFTPPPQGERTFYPTEKVEMFDSATAAGLQTAINTFIGTLATPVTPAVKNTIVAIEYSHIEDSTPTMHYTALMRYIEWNAE